MTALSEFAELTTGADADIIILTDDTDSTTKKMTLANVKAYISSKLESAGDVIEANTEMVFHQDTAPTGWTLDATLDDKLLFITKGSGAGGETGGGTHSSGTWTQPDHTHTLAHTHGMNSHTHNDSDHILTEAEMPAHTHSYVGGASDKCDCGGNTGGNFVGGYSTGSTGGDTAHNHGATSGPSTANTEAASSETTSGSATANTWRPAAYNAIIAAKDAF